MRDRENNPDGGGDMTAVPTDVERRLQTLEAKVQEVEAMLTLAMRLLSVEKPVSVLLRRYGATEAEELAVHQLLDEAAVRAERGGVYAPSFSAFIGDLYERFPAVRGDREFVSLLLDTLKLDRPAYQQLQRYVAANGWPESS